MKKSREAIGAALTVVSLFGVALATAGGDSVKTPENIASSRYTPGLQRLSNRIIELTKQSENRISDQSANSEGFMVATDNNGTLTLSTQTKPQSPKAGQVETIDVQQLIPGGRAFDLRFQIADGKWSVDCQDNVAGSTALSETSEAIAYVGEKTLYADPADAQAVLSAAIYNATAIANQVAAHPDNSLMQPVGDPCPIALGDG